MPELPEVETTVNKLRPKIQGQTVKSVWFDLPSVALAKEGASRTSRELVNREFKNKLIGMKISGIKRRGKNILIYLQTAKKSQTIQKIPRKSAFIGIRVNQRKSAILLIHQKISGHLLYGAWNKQGKDWVAKTKGPLRERVNNYIHFILAFKNGKMLALSDLRKFAKIVFGEKEQIENSADIEKLGPEALDVKLTFKKFKNLIVKRNRTIKDVLMDQGIIAGIGNIYASEILYLSKVHPLARTNKLKDKELRAIYSAMKRVLKQAIKLGGTSISDYRWPSGELGYYSQKRRIYQREGEKCKRCGADIKRIKQGQRSSFYCPRCQKI